MSFLRRRIPTCRRDFAPEARRPSASRIPVALVLALAVLALERAGWIAWAGAPRVGLVLLPWIVVAGAPHARAARAGGRRSRSTPDGGSPRAGSTRAGGSPRSAWARARGAIGAGSEPELAPLCALPVVVLAAAVDRAETGAWAVVPAVAGLALVALFALGAARGGRWYAGLWLFSTALPAGLASAFALSAAAGGAGPAGAGAWIASTPWVWAARAIAAGAEDGAGASGPLAWAALLAAVGLAEGARREAAGERG